jgi:dihydrofolate reductase
VYIATSLDGYIATVDGSTDFLTAVEVAGEDYGYAEFESTVDAFVVGSHTYEGALEMSAWPYAKRVVVLTTATHRVSQHGEEFFSGDVRDLTLRLGGEGLRHLYIDGGVTIRSFLAADLVDNLTISIIPVLLGAGVPLFTEAKSPTRRLTLTSCQPYDSGLVQLRYAAGVTAA